MCETLFEPSPLLPEIHLQRRLKLSPDLQQVSLTATGFVQDPPPSLLQLHCGLWSLVCRRPPATVTRATPVQAGAGRQTWDEMLQLPHTSSPDAPPAHAVSIQTLNGGGGGGGGLQTTLGLEREGFLLLVLADLKPCASFQHDACDKVSVKVYLAGCACERECVSVSVWK